MKKSTTDLSNYTLSDPRTECSLAVVANNEPNDALSAYQIPNRSWFSWVLAYYRDVHLPSGIAVIQRNVEEGCSYIDWHLRESIGEKSMFYMQLLNGCTPLLIKGHIARTSAIWLRGQVMTSLNEAVSDPQRRRSCAVLSTVGSIACHEMLYGDREAAMQVHRPAFEKLLDMLGGLTNLQVPRIEHVLLRITGNVLSESPLDDDAVKLITRWASDEMRQAHPGYELQPNIEILLRNNDEAKSRCAGEGYSL